MRPDVNVIAESCTKDVDPCAVAQYSIPARKHHRRVATAAAVLNGIDYHKFCWFKLFKTKLTKRTLREKNCMEKSLFNLSFLKPGSWWNALTCSLVRNSLYPQASTQLPRVPVPKHPWQTDLCGRTLTLEYFWHWYSSVDFRKVLQEPLVNSGCLMMFDGYIIRVQCNYIIASNVD